MLMQTHEARLEALRKELARRGLDGFVIPISDEHMSEYVGAYAQRLAWLTGFGGSAATAVVLKDKAAIFVDGRYTLQVRDQVDGRLWEYQAVPANQPREMAGRKCRAKARPSVTMHGSIRRAGRIRPRRHWPQGAPGSSRWPAIRSTPYGRTGPKPRWPRRWSTKRSMPAVRARQKRADVAEWLQGGESRCGRDRGAQFDCLAAQYSRLGCRAHAGRPVLCPRSCRRHRRSVHRARKSHARTHRPSRQCRAAARPR